MKRAAVILAILALVIAAVLKTADWWIVNHDDHCGILL